MRTKTKDVETRHRLSSELILICFQIFQIVTEGVAADKVLFFHEFKLTFVVSRTLAKTNLLKNLQGRILMYFYFQLEKQQKKLEAKGIMVEISQLRQEWEAARNGGKGGNNEPILEHEIDVVGDDSDNEDQDDLDDQSDLSPQSQKPLNAFSIDNLLASRYQLDSKTFNSVVKEEIQQ